MAEDLSRMQFAMDRALYDRIGELAEAVDQSQSWMAWQLLEAILDDREHLAETIATRAMSLLARPFVPNVKPTGETVYLQANVSERVRQEVEQFSENLEHTSSKGGGLLLQLAVQDHGWILDAIGGTRRAMRRLEELLKEPNAKRARS